MRAEFFFFKGFVFKGNKGGGAKHVLNTAVAYTRQDGAYRINKVDVVNICYAVIMSAAKFI